MCQHSSGFFSIPLAKFNLAVLCCLWKLSIEVDFMQCPSHGLISPRNTSYHICRNTYSKSEELTIWFSMQGCVNGKLCHLSRVATAPSVIGSMALPWVHLLTAAVAVFQLMFRSLLILLYPLSSLWSLTIWCLICSVPLTIWQFLLMWSHVALDTTMAEKERVVVFRCYFRALFMQLAVIWNNRYTSFFLYWGCTLFLM